MVRTSVLRLFGSSVVLWLDREVSVCCFFRSKVIVERAAGVEWGGFVKAQNSAKWYLTSQQIQKKAMKCKSFYHRS